jgi:spermidine synthase
MKTRRHTKLLHEGGYVAEVDITIIDSDDGWSPYLSLEDAAKLDEVREALRRGDVAVAQRHARVYQLTPAHAA